MSSSENKEYSVNWKNHMSHVRKAFDNLLSTNELTDVTLYCEGKKIGAHKMLLSACSTYFRDTFKEVPCQHPVIILYGVEYSVLSDILQFIYRGEVSVDTAKLDSFLKTAQLLQISGLTDDPSDRLVVENDQSENDQSTEVSRSEQAPEEDYTETIQSTSTSEDTKRGTKRLKLKETDAPREKIHRPAESDTLFVSDVKCEPSELVNFEDPLEDPLLQSDQSSDTREFFGTGTQGDEEFKMEAEDEVICTSPHIRENAEKTIENLLPVKSKPAYDKEYAAFNEWCQEKGTLKATENVLLAYFQEKSETKKSSTLWTSYSMLRACLNVYQNCDISKFPRLLAFLKRQSQGYEPKKSKILDITEINQFLVQADDLHYLAMKVVLIMGYAGGCRRDELTNMSTDDVDYKEDAIHVRVPKTKTNVARLFVIIEAHWVRLVKKYASLRPTGITTKRFFLTYRNGRCTTSPIGINKISQVPRTIANFLNLVDPEQYTGHCFRRSSASNLANNGADLITIKHTGPGSLQQLLKGTLKRH